MKLKYFKMSEFGCRHCGKVHMDKRLLSILDNIREDHGEPIIISSGYRCPTYNNIISSTGFDGPHTTGKAVDIPCRGKKAYDILRLAYKHGITGIGINQRGLKRFIHLDIIESNELRPWVWSY